MQQRKIAFLLILLFLAACNFPLENQPTIPEELPTNDAVVTPITVDTQGPELPMGKLLFVKGGNIWLLSGADVSPLTTGGKTVQPTWSPDGAQIVYVQREESYSDLYLKSPHDTGRGLRLTQNEPPGIEARSLIHVRSVKWGFYPSWSPDGTTLAYVSQQVAPSGTNEVPLALFLIDMAQTVSVENSPSRRLVYTRGGFDLQHPSWSPDSRYLAFTQTYRFDKESRPEIRFYDTQTGEIFSLDNIPANSYDPTWSPDGRWLVFARREGATTELWAIAAPPYATGSDQPFMLTSIGDVRAPVWSPDGKHIAFLIFNEAGSIDLAVAAVRQGSAKKLVLTDPIILLENEKIDADSRLAWAR